MASHDGVLYVADASGDELWIVNVTTPSSSTLVGDFPSGLTFPSGMASHDGVLYVVDNTGDELWIVNVTTPGSSTLVGDFPSLLGAPEGMASHSDSTTTTTDHAINAGDVAWVFDWPQPTSTHVSAAPIDHAIDAGDVAWVFDWPQPTSTHGITATNWTRILQISGSYAIRFVARDSGFPYDGGARLGQMPDDMFTDDTMAIRLNRIFSETHSGAQRFGYSDQRYAGDPRDAYTALDTNGVLVWINETDQTYVVVEMHPRFGQGDWGGSWQSGNQSTNWDFVDSSYASEAAAITALNNEDWRGDTIIFGFIPESFTPTFGDEVQTQNYTINAGDVAWVFDWPQPRSSFIETSDWDDTGYGSPIVLALLEAAVSGADITADPVTAVDGDLVVATDLTISGVERTSGFTALRLRRTGSGALDSYFDNEGTPTYSGAKLFIVIEDGKDTVQISFTVDAAGTSFSNWYIDDTDQQADWDAIATYDRFVLAIAEPIANEPPTVVIDTSPKTVDASAVVTLEATVTDNEGHDYTVLWTGSGTFGTVTAEDTTWIAPAPSTDTTYTLTLTATDEFGLAGFATVDINVRANPTGRIADVYGNETASFTDQAVTNNAT